MTTPTVDPGASSAGWRFGELAVVAGIALAIAVAVHVAVSLSQSRS
jgi:hypothetical protein